jgi:hypothetical protein
MVMSTENTRGAVKRLFQCENGSVLASVEIAASPERVSAP